MQEEQITLSRREQRRAQVLNQVLDPSSLEGVTGSKGCFDCTKPLGKPFAERLSVPGEVLERVDPVELLGRQQYERIPVEPWG